ncbi:interferon-induced, double-stranded RNA-activated protein kinase isoform X2 [Sphaerodactylus townsendi]|nr:interferon-induced, double-stranded RNA-activated protein kinase isoform X2 [Sphaerodactylus townsendi]
MVDNQAALRKYTADLNEYCQKKQLKYDYKDVDVTGPPHDRIFTVMVVIEEKEYPPATGKSKREARKRAAKLTWETILHEEARSASAPLQQPQPSLPPSSPPSQLPQPSSDVVSSSMNYIGFLNEYALKNKVYVQYPLMDKSGEEHKPNFSCACTVDGEIYGEGTGKNKQTAKNNAAKQAYEKLIAQSASKTEQSAASINRFLHNSQEASEEASMNGMDSDLECKGINGKPATEIGASSTETGASSALGSPAVSAVKSKRRETLLAPTFSKLHQRENKYTTNEKFLDNFVDIEKIGSGGFGRVFKAKHKIDEKLRAVKRVELNLEEEMAEAKREVKALADLKHDHIVRYYGCWIGKDSFNLEDSIGGKRDLIKKKKIGKLYVARIGRTI